MENNYGLYQTTHPGPQSRIHCPLVKSLQKTSKSKKTNTPTYAGMPRPSLFLIAYV